MSIHPEPSYRPKLDSSIYIFAISILSWFFYGYISIIWMLSGIKIKTTRGFKSKFTTSRSSCKYKTTSNSNRRRVNRNKNTDNTTTTTTTTPEREAAAPAPAPAPAPAATTIQVCRTSKLPKTIPRFQEN